MKFFISGLGGDMAQSISRIIKLEFKDCIIYGTDISDRNAAELYCDEFVLGIKANDPGYIDFIKNFIYKMDIDLFIPCTEHELRVLINLDENDSIWNKILSCAPNILRTCLDKFTTFEFLKENSIPVPWFASKSSDSIINYPCIYKKRSSSGSRDIFIVNNIEEAQFLEKYSKNGLFQELLQDSDKEYTCSVFRWGDSYLSIQLLRNLTGGSTSWAQVTQDKEIDALCRNVSQAFDLKGSLNIQLRLTPKGPMIFEINPRFSSTVYMRHLLGFKDLAWSIKTKLNKDASIEFSNLRIAKIVKVSDSIIL